MKKFKSFLALLLLGGLVATGCGGKDKTPSNSGGSQQNSGDSQSGDSGSGGGNQGGEGGGQQGGGGEQGGGGQQGGGGEGGGELPQNSRFVNKKFIVDTVETQPQVAQMETGYANAYISLFQDSSCELVAPHDDTYDVLFGTYGVNEADNLATMSIKKSFDGLEQLYSWSLPTALRTLSLHYLSETDRFQVSMSFTYPATTMTLTLRALPNPPMHIVGDGVPQDPNGDSFNEQYQVEQYRYDQFLGDLSYSTKNLTVNATVPNLWLVNESEEYVIEQQGNKFHLDYPGYPNSEAYYEVVNEVRDEQGVLQSLRVDAYTRPGGVWQLSENQVYDPDFFQIVQGFVPVRFLETTYVGSENARYYFASDTSYLDYSGVTDPTRYQITNFRAAFENNNLKSVSYKQDARDYSFTVSKYNQTTIELPDVSDPSPEDYYSNIENKVFVFSEASGSGLSNPSDKAFVEALYENATLSLFANPNKDAELHMYKTTNDGVNVIDGESILYGTYNLSQLDETYAKGGFTFVGFLEGGVYQTATGWYSMWYKIETSQIRINLGGSQFLWFNVTNLVPSQTTHPDPSGGGGDPLVDWPSATVTQYLSALGATQDSLPYIQHQNITEYTFTPDLASVDDYFTIRCANGGSLSATYESQLILANFEYDNSEYWYVSPHQEFAVEYSTDGLNNFNISVYKVVPSTPAAAESYLNAKASFETWTGITLPTVNNLGATFYEDTDSCMFYTADGATSDTLSVFVSHFNSTLSTWEHEGPLTPDGNTTRHTYTSPSGDEITIDYYDYGAGNSYLVVSFFPHPLSAQLLVKGETPLDISLKDGSSTEYYLKVMLEKDDEFKFVINDETFGYSSIKNGGVKDLFIEGDDGMLKCTEDHYYEIYVETATEGGTGKGIYISASYYGFYDPDTDAWYTADISLKDGSDTEYYVQNFEVVVGTSLYFRINGVYYKADALKTCDAALWFDVDENGNLKSLVDGEFELYCDTVADGEGNHIYLNGDLNYDSYIVQVLYGDDSTWDDYLELKPGQLDEFLLEDVELEAGDRIRFLVARDYATLKVDDEHSSSSEFESAGGGYYRCKTDGHYDFYVKIIGGDVGIWVVKHVDPLTQIPYTFYVDDENRWILNGDAKLYVWAWGEGFDGCWYEAMVEGDEYTFNIPLGCTRGILVRAPEIDDLYTWDGETTVWNQSEEFTLSGTASEITEQIKP